MKNDDYFIMGKENFSELSKHLSKACSNFSDIMGSRVFVLPDLKNIFKVKDFVFQVLPEIKIEKFNYSFPDPIFNMRQCYNIDDFEIKPKLKDWRIICPSCYEDSKELFCMCPHCGAPKESREIPFKKKGNDFRNIVRTEI